MESFSSMNFPIGTNTFCFNFFDVRLVWQVFLDLGAATIYLHSFFIFIFKIHSTK